MDKIRLICSIHFLLILTYTIANAQGVNNNWYFGNQAAVSFSSGSPVFTPGSQMIAGEGVASVSDNSGNLLFYTNGRKVWNKNHQIMPNGSLLTSSGTDASQGVVIVPFPNHPNEYFIFTTNGGGVPPPGTSFNFMAYSRVDMTADGGLGDIVELNTPLKDHLGSTTWVGKVEAITAISNNNENYWVVLPHRTKLLSYYVDENGVDVNPVQSDISWVISTTSHIKVSPSNDYLAITEFQGDKTTLYGFDGSLGQVTSSTPLGYFILQGGNGYDLGIYSSEFSIQNDILWLSIYDASTPLVYGFDLNDLNATPTILQLSPSYPLGTIQRGPDDEMYLTSGSNSYLHRLNNANDLNSAFVTEQAVYLGGTNSTLGLPQLVLPYVSSCQENIVLSNPETNNNITYEVSNIITTNSSYMVSQNQNIVLSAGNSVLLLPDTNIQSGSDFLAKIEGCTLNRNTKQPKKVEIIETKTIYIDLRDNGSDEVKIYPNPTSGNIINIAGVPDSSASVQIFDVTGNRVSSGKVLNQSYDLKGLTSGMYFLRIDFESNSTVIKLVVN